ncbi:MAG: glycosyltransferase family 2 protein [Coriobacteriia bacterium]|nr:glycosyltransferase family 2 protein [Coriobacteriia bacterium]
MTLLTGSAVVLPVYNEAAPLSGVLDAVRRVHTGGVIVVDDGSTDGTRRLLARRDDVTVVSHRENLGYGRSLIDGFARALDSGAEAIVTMDCDGQHEPEHIPEFLAALESCDIASGSRYLPESPAVGTAPPERQDVNRRVTASINAVTGWAITDAFCGFKAYRASAIRAMTLTEPGYALPLEVWAEAHWAGLCVIERPVARIYFDGDRSFGADLDDPERRHGYYLRVWERALNRGRDDG